MRFFDAVERAQSPGADLAHLVGTASKTAEQAARVAGVFAPWQDLDANEVQELDMANAIELARYYLLEASRLAEVSNVSAEKPRR